MSSDVAIAVNRVGKYYHIYEKPLDRLKQSFYRGRRQFYKEFNALDNISFEVNKGETVGIIGRNGSGKSTLLQMICGTLTPTNGEIKLNGRVAALLELGAGFNPEFTGRENVYMNASILGLSKPEINEIYSKILEFAGIGDFIEQPVKTYSSGMYVRLAFAVAINVDPDILIVDEALSVGDMNFQAKCMTAITRIQEGGSTVLFVSHDIQAVKSLCSRCIYLDNGNIKMIGAAGDVAEGYIRDMRGEMNSEVRKEPTNISHEYAELRNEQKHLKSDIGVECTAFKKSEAFDSRVAAFRYGAGGVKATFVELLDKEGVEIIEAEFNQEVFIKIHIECSLNTLLGPIYYIMDEKKNLILGAGPRQLDMPFIKVKEESSYIIIYKTYLPLQEGNYSIQIQLNRPIQEGFSAEYLDVVDDAVVFKMARKKSGRIWAKVYIDNEMEVVTV